MLRLEYGQSSQPDTPVCVVTNAFSGPTKASAVLERAEGYGLYDETPQTSVSPYLLFPYGAERRS